MKNNLLNNAIFVVNPVAGKLSLSLKKQIINKIIGEHKSEVVVTKSIIHSEDVAFKAMKKNKLVVACGGDGIQNIIADKAIETGAKMAVLPLGRGNDFAMSLNIHSPKDLINSFIEVIDFINLILSSSLLKNKNSLSIHCGSKSSVVISFGLNSNSFL